MGFAKPLGSPGFSSADQGNPADPSSGVTHAAIIPFTQATTLPAAQDILDDAQPYTDLASATTTSIGGVASSKVRITGTTTITGLGTIGTGIKRKVRFADALTLTHHATALILPGAANITTAANDTAEFVSLGSGNWICTHYKRASGQPLAVVSVAQGGTSAATAVAAMDALEAQGADIASAATTDLSAATGRYVHITGTTTITALGTATAGVRRKVKFTGALTLTYNATSLILPGLASITTAANDTAEFASLGSGNWVCLWYKRASGLLLGAALATAAQSRDTTDTTHALSPSNMLDLGVQRLLFSLTGANMNVTTDQPMTKHGTFTSWIVRVWHMTNASISLTTAVGGAYGEASKAGVVLMAASQAYSALTSSAHAVLAGAPNAGGGVRTETPIISLTTPQGAAATADFRLFGWPIS